MSLTCSEPIDTKIMSKKSLVEDPDQKSIGAPSKLLENGKLQQKEDQSPANQSRAFGSLGDLYFSESAGTLDTNSDSSQTSPSSGVMTDRVQRIASSIYAEFKVMIETYGLPVVERLMPLVVGLLENLDELYKDQAAYHEEVYQLRDQNSFMVGELEREKDRRKQAELRLIHVEDAFDEERKTHETKVEELTLSGRQVELKYQNLKDQFARMEAKEAEWKKESQRLHEHINELIRSKLDLADQVKFANQSSSRLAAKTDAPGHLGSSNASTFGIVVGLSGDGDTALHSGMENMYDATSGGFGFDEMTSSDAEGVIPDEEIPDDSASPPIATADNDTGAFAGMRREIDILIRENMELVETNQQLCIWSMLQTTVFQSFPNLPFGSWPIHSENASLRESVSHLTQSRSTLQSELASTDQLLNDTRHELEELRDRLAATSRRFELSNEIVIFFSWPDLKTEAQHSHICRTYGIFALDFYTTPGIPSYCVLYFSHGVSQSWVCLSRAWAAAPMYGWSRGLDSPHSKRCPSTVKSNPDVTCAQSQTVPLPVQCRSIGGLHGNQLEIVSALLVTLPTSGLKDAKSDHQIWLIGRGPGHNGLLASPNAGGRGSVGQVLVFEVGRFSQPLHTFDLENGFMPTAAVFVHDHLGRQFARTSPIGHNTLFVFTFCAASTCGLVCLSLSDPSGTSQLNVFRLSEAMNHASNNSSTGKITRTHQLITIPGDCVATGPVMMALDTRLSPDQSRHVWLGTAGGGHCHELDLNTRQFAQRLVSILIRRTFIFEFSLRLPQETPCLHAICVQPQDTNGGFNHIWLAVSGASNTNVDGTCATAATEAHANRGMARLIAFRTDTRALVYQIDLTTPLCAMIEVFNRAIFPFRKLNGCCFSNIFGPFKCLDTEGVTDPIDLTVCRLLLVSDGLTQSLWFATRSGIIGRFPVPVFGGFLCIFQQLDLVLHFCFTGCHSIRQID
ncbi:Homeobox protein six [Fasciolopsis buskii]|uniref:Homeobox protein six n=1 Tax=Fasciolopsis buskii TaxID=27845 RepID=A0A8E0RLC6_9TREM|nr:Homeobox protein six [Fasciolopsis buski]